MTRESFNMSSQYFKTQLLFNLIEDICYNAPSEEDDSKIIETFRESWISVCAANRFVDSDNVNAVPLGVTKSMLLSMAGQKQCHDKDMPWIYDAIGKKLSYMRKTIVSYCQDGNIQDSVSGMEKANADAVANEPISELRMSFALVKLRMSVVNLACENLDLLSEILSPEVKDGSESYPQLIATHCRGMCLRLRTLLLKLQLVCSQLKCDMYNETTIPALVSIFTELENLEQQTSASFARCEQLLEAYKNTEPGFLQVVAEYRRVSEKLSNKRWALKTLQAAQDVSNSNISFPGSTFYDTRSRITEEDLSNSKF